MSECLSLFIAFLRTSINIQNRCAQKINDNYVCITIHLYRPFFTSGFHALQKSTFPTTFKKRHKLFPAVYQMDNRLLLLCMLHQVSMMLRVFEQSCPIHETKNHFFVALSIVVHNFMCPMKQRSNSAFDTPPHFQVAPQPNFETIVR